MKKKTPGITYQVGGCIRDALLGLPHLDHDYVVVGTTPDAMREAGFLPVGKSFPVFLHPETHEEYALARTERKTARGHQGFLFSADPSITLEEDLKRRDLTINAIAKDSQDQLIDPYGGVQDLQNHVLRHVSSAFSEDPLRIFRVARFRAYLGRFDFKIASETLKLMQEMIRAGAIDELSDERIWQEFEKALNSSHPELFILTLQEINALRFILPNLSPQGIQALIRTKKQTQNPLIRFACLSFEGPYAKKLPKDYEDLQKLTQAQVQNFEAFNQLSLDKKLEFLQTLDFLRRPERSQDFLIAAEIITQNSKARSAIESAIQSLKTLDRASLSQQAKTQGQNIKTFIKDAEKKQLSSKSWRYFFKKLFSIVKNS